MSTKLNARSPFYLTLTEPTVPTPTFTCVTAGVLDASGNTIFPNFAVNAQGVVTVGDLTAGTVLAFTSSAGDFANGKFAAVGTNTSRTVVFTIAIPAGFSNTSTGVLNCSAVTTQSPPDSCTGGITNNGSISNLSINTASSPSSITLASFFNGTPTRYFITNNNPSFMTVSVTGATTSLEGENTIIADGNATVLKVESGSIAGTQSISVEGRDASFPSSCSSVQNFDVTIAISGNALACTSGTNQTAIDTEGGSMTAAGVLTVPSSSAKIIIIKESDDTVRATGTADLRGTPVSGFPANTTGSDRTVNVKFTFVIPAGYTNSGNLECTIGITQFASTASFSCDDAGLTGQKISKNGAIFVGSFATVNNSGGAEDGKSIKDFSPPSFAPVTVETPRDVTFNVYIPSGFSDTGDGNQTKACQKTLLQPPTGLQVPDETATDSTKGYKYFISKGKGSPAAFCDAIYGTTVEVLSRGNAGGSANVDALKNSVIYRNDTPFDGEDLFYIITTLAKGSAGGLVNPTGSAYQKFTIVQISTSGVVLAVRPSVCKADAGNTVPSADESNIIAGGEI
jgi:hypothetical protein